MARDWCRVVSATWLLKMLSLSQCEKKPSFTQLSIKHNVLLPSHLHTPADGCKVVYELSFGRVLTIYT